MSANNDTTNPLTPKERRKQRLALELRSNLRRRKCKTLADNPSEPADEPTAAPETHDKRA